MDIEALVGRAQEGERKAFGQLYDQLAPKVYGYFYYQLGGDAGVAETLTENVFAEVLARLSHYSVSQRGFVVWVLWIARNRLGAYLDSRRGRDLISTYNSTAWQEQGHGSDFNRPLTQSEVIYALAHLTEDEREVIVLRFLYGVSVRDVAHVLGNGEDLIKQVQARGLTNLVQALDASARCDRGLSLSASPVSPTPAPAL
jgi:RNA polymerase sigma-70 factor (ECF subfamily)